MVQLGAVESAPGASCSILAWWEMIAQGLCCGRQSLPNCRAHVLSNQGLPGSTAPVIAPCTPFMIAPVRRLS